MPPVSYDEGTKTKEDSNMLNELGISTGTAIIILICLYFVIKWAVKNGITEAYTSITGSDTAEDRAFKEALGLEEKPEEC